MSEWTEGWDFVLSESARIAKGSSIFSSQSGYLFDDHVTGWVPSFPQIGFEEGLRLASPIPQPSALSLTVIYVFTYRQRRICPRT
jgi:hypothetical protein